MIFETFTSIANSLRGTDLERLPLVRKSFSKLYKALEPSNCLKLVGVEDFKMLVDIRDMGDVGTSLRRKHTYHPQMTHVLRRMIEPGMVCIDIGANIGYFTVIMSRAVGESGKVYAFEPDETNFSLLQKNLELNECKNVIPERLAISNVRGRTELFVDRINFGGHSLERKGKIFSTQDVPVSSLDYWLGSRQKVDFAKIDVEGEEAKVLEGMEGILGESPSIVLVVEYLPDMDSVEYLEKLVSKGFGLWHINEFQNSTLPITPFLIEKLWKKENGMNILAIRR